MQAPIAYEEPLGSANHLMQFIEFEVVVVGQILYRVRKDCMGSGRSWRTRRMRGNPWVGDKWQSLYRYRVWWLQHAQRPNVKGDGIEEGSEQSCSAQQAPAREK